MREIAAFEAENTLGALLDLVQHGEEIVITRRGKPVARLVRETGKSDRTTALAAAERIRARAKAVGSASITLQEWKEFRDEGRS